MNPESRRVRGDVMSSVARLGFLLDRTAVLFVGLAAGAAIAFSFFPETVAIEPVAAITVPPVTQPVSATARTPALPETSLGPNLTAAAASGRSVHVGVFGDSFGEGLWAGLYNGLRSAEGIEVHRFGGRSTGFTRYRSLNLLDDIRGKLDRQPVDIAVVSFGANDIQGIFQDGRGAAYMSAEWQRIVGERVDAVVALLRERGATVYWVGLPVMRDAGFNANIRQMNAFYAARMQALGVPYVDTAALSAGADGQYSPYLPDPQSGAPVMARVNDGIHMTIPGYVMLTRGLRDSIRRSVMQARAEARAAPGRQAAVEPQREGGSHG